MVLPARQITSCHHKTHDHQQGCKIHVHKRVDLDRDVGRRKPSLSYQRRDSNLTDAKYPCGYASWCSVLQDDRTVFVTASERSVYPYIFDERTYRTAVDLVLARQVILKPSERQIL